MSTISYHSNILHEYGVMCLAGLMLDYTSNVPVDLDLIKFGGGGGGGFLHVFQADSYYYYYNR